MARTVIPVVDLPRYGRSAELSVVTGNATDGMSFQNNGQTILLVLNTSAAGVVSCTIASEKDEFGRLKDLDVDTPAASALNGPSFSAAGPLKQLHYNEGAGSSVAIDSSPATLRFAAFKYQF